jgi:hypothetical protein
MFREPVFTIFLIPGHTWRSQIKEAVTYVAASKCEGLRFGLFYCLGLLMWTGRLPGASAREYDVSKRC